MSERTPTATAENVTAADLIAPAPASPPPAVETPPMVETMPPPPPAPEPTPAPAPTVEAPKKPHGGPGRGQGRHRLDCTCTRCVLKKTGAMKPAASPAPPEPEAPDFSELGEPGTTGTAEPVQAQPAQPLPLLASANYEGLAAATFDMSVGGLVMIFGDDWKPENKDEREGVIASLAAYYKFKGVQDMPPGVVLAMVCLAYATKRLTKPTTLDRIKHAWGWVKVKLLGRRK